MSDALDRLHLILWRWIEQRTLRRLQRSWPEEWHWTRKVTANNGDAFRVFLDEAYDKLVTEPSLVSSQPQERSDVKENG